jgi:hypothetical protein
MIRTHLLAKVKNPFAERVRKTARALDKILAVLSETSHCHPARLRSVQWTSCQELDAILAMDDRS